MSAIHEELLELRRFRAGKTFTPRQMAVIEYICQEKTSGEIGKLMFASPRTIQCYVETIKSKMGVKSYVGIALYAVKHGIFKIN